RPHLINVVGETALLHAHLDKAEVVSEQIVDKAATAALHEVSAEPDRTLAIDPAAAGNEEQGPVTQLFKITREDILRDRALKELYAAEKQRDEAAQDEDDVDEAAQDEPAQDEVAEREVIEEASGDETVEEKSLEASTEDDDVIARPDDPFSGVYDDEDDGGDYEDEDDDEEDERFAGDNGEEDASWDDDEPDEDDEDRLVREFPEEEEPETEFIYHNGEAVEEEATISGGDLLWEEEPSQVEDTVVTQIVGSTSGEIEEILMSEEIGTRAAAFQHGFMPDDDPADSHHTGGFDVGYVRQSIDGAQPEDVEPPPQLEADFAPARKRSVWPLGIAAGVLIIIFLGGGGFLLNQELDFTGSKGYSAQADRTVIEETPASVVKAPDSASAASVESRPVEKPRVVTEAMRIPSLDDLPAADSEPDPRTGEQTDAPQQPVQAQTGAIPHTDADQPATDQGEATAAIFAGEADDQPISSGEEHSAVVEPEQGQEESLTGQALIDSLLAQAKRQYDNKRLTTPASDNAFATYKKVLALESDNEQALTGVRKIKQRYKYWAESAFEEGNLTNAREFYRRALVVDPHDVVLRAALANLRARAVLRRSDDSGNRENDAERGSRGPLQHLRDNLSSQNQ
ncbi:MAG: hypothetical protein ACR2RB_19435, partial [Gammaproteobacteria bacterium]